LDGELPTSSLTLSPTAIGSTTFQVTSATSAANGSYPVSATAKNRGATSYTATASATYVVANIVPCTLANPTVSLDPPVGDGVAAGTTVPFTVLVTSNDSASCPGAIFDVTNAVPAGWSGSISPASITLSSGASGSTTFR
jgi:hypothetical protein